MRTGRRWQGLNTKTSPLSPPASAPPANAHFPHGLTAILQRSATPRQQRLGRFCLFLPLPPGLHQTPAPLSFRLQKFTLRPSSRPAVHHSAFFCIACIRKRLAYRRGLFSVPDGESPQGYRVLRLRRSNLNTNMPIESNFGARL